MITSHVSGRNMMVGDALTHYVYKHIENIESKYFGEVISSNVVFTKGKRGVKFKCSIRITCKKGIVFTSTSTDSLVYRSFNQAVSNVASQIKRKKTVLVDDKPINFTKENVFEEHNKINLDEVLNFEAVS